MSDKTDSLIYEDSKYCERVYFDSDGDLICESWTPSECGNSSNVLNKELQIKLYEQLKKRLGK